MIANTNKRLSAVNPLLWQLTCFLISSGIFCVFILNRKIVPLGELGFSARVDFFPIIPILAVVMYLVFLIRGRVGELMGMAFAMALFSLPLIGLWQSGHTHTTALGGLIPLGDAKIYYVDALRLTTGSDFSDFSARRPLFSAMLAVFLAFTHYNLMASLAIFSGLNGYVCYLSAREIQRIHGPEVAAFIFMMVYLFYRLHSGTAMTENLGLFLGILGFIFLWRGAGEGKLSGVLIGLFVSTLALNARAGAFFILPFLIMWTGRVFRSDRNFGWRNAGLATLAILLGFSANLVFTRLVSVPSGVPFANFSYSLYGLASGGKSWFYIYQVHPEVFSLPEPEHSRRVYQLAFELIRNDPLQTLNGALFNWKMLLSDNLYSLYSYVAHENWNVNPLIKWSLYLLSLIGVLVGFVERADSRNSLILAGILGIFLSVPFAPPIDTFRLRQFSASVGFLTLLPGLGLAYLVRRSGVFTAPVESYPITGISFLLLFTIAAVCINLILPPILKDTSFVKTPRFNPCPEGEDSVIVRLDAGSFIRLRPKNEELMAGLPALPIDLFRREAHSLSDSNMIDWLQHLQPPLTMVMTLNRATNGAVLVVLPEGTVPSMGDASKICGEYESDPGLEFFKDIFYGESLIVSDP